MRFGLVSYKDYNKGDQLLSFSRHTDADADAGALEHKGAKVEGAKAELARPPAAAPAAAAAVEVEAAPVLSRGLRAVMRSARPGRLHRRRGGGGGGGNGFADGSAARIFDFTNDMAKMQSYVDCQRATGGGDGPEAVATALHCADLMAWREDAARIAVLITDAPPHGIEQSGSDNFPDGDPGCRDCLEIARSLADKDVTCYTVACEPSVTQSYVYCRDFLAGVAEITGGMLVPLKSAAMLTDLILASCKEGADLAKAQAVVQAALEKAKSEDPTLRGDDLAARAASKLAAAGVRVHQTRETANAYAKFSKKNVVLFADDAATLRSCRERLTPAAAPAGWDAGLESQQIRSEVATLSADQCSRMMTKHRRKAGWGY